MLKGSLKKLVKAIASIIALFTVFYLLVHAVEEAETKYKGDLTMGAGKATARSESFSVGLTKEEKSMVKAVRSHYGFTSDRELLIALIKRAHLNMTKK